jgi:hypothetical protein
MSGHRVDRRPRRWVLWVGVLLTVTLGLTGCSGVPDNSLPQVVRTVNNNGQATTSPPVTPEPGEGPREIVAGFLSAQLDDDASHQAAKDFLTAEAAQRWTATTVTVLDAEPRRKDLEGTATEGTVVVVGLVVGTLDNTSGAYTPTLPGNGKTTKDFSFGLVQVDGQWRISSAPNGLIVTRSNFGIHFPRQVLYFFNQSETRLIPDVRYSALQGQSLATWIVGQLIAGPLQAPTTPLVNEFPTQITPDRAKVTMGNPIVVQLTGLSGIDAGRVSLIAATIAYAFSSLSSADITLQDGSKTINASGLIQFSRGDYAQYEPIPTTASSLYFVHDGALASSDGKSVGFVTNRRLGSVAVVASGARDLDVAGLSEDRETLYLGKAGTTPRAVALGNTPATTRPEWVASDPTAAPNEVWIGRGAGLFRYVNNQFQPVGLTSSTDLSGRVVRAVRVSPDGTRVALVLANAAGGTGSAIWVGLISRVANPVQIVSLQQITPSTWQVHDVAWSTEGSTGSAGLLLRATGSESGGAPIAVWRISVDGSSPSATDTTDLPDVPDYVASSIQDGTTWVSSGQRVWQEVFGGGWTNPLPNSGQADVAPVYAAE